jgi:hypothetical protein
MPISNNPHRRFLKKLRKRIPLQKIVCAADPLHEQHYCSEKEIMATQSIKNGHLPCPLEPGPLEQMEGLVARPVQLQQEKREIADFASGGVK